MVRPGLADEVTPCRKKILPRTVTAHTRVSLGAPLGRSCPPAEMSKKGSSVGSLACTGGMTDQESVATYFRYLIHFLLLTQEVKVFFGWYSAGKSTAYVHPSLPNDLPSWFVSRYHMDSQDQAMEGNFT